MCIQHPVPLRNSFSVLTVLLLGLLSFDSGHFLFGKEETPKPVVRFVKARPIWPTGKQKEKNLTVGFRTLFQPSHEGRIILRATGSSLYRVFLNNTFLGHGPARGPHGYFRVDEWDLTNRLQPGTNLVAFEVAGYNVNSYYLLDQPAFLQAEIIDGGTVLAATGDSSFEAIALGERVQKVQRYSYQRPFSEVYRLKPGYDRWRSDPAAPCRPIAWSVQPSVQLIPRRVAHPDYLVRQPSMIVSQGSLISGAKPERLVKERFLTEIGPNLGGFLEGELETIPSIDLQYVRNGETRLIGRPYDPSSALEMKPGSFQILDLGVNLTGFVGARLDCRTKTRLYVTFDEVLTKGDVDFLRLNCANVVTFDVEPGRYALESFESYTMRYMKLMVLDGDCSVGSIFLRELADSSSKEARFAASDPRFTRLFEAGRETFRQNSLDIFMDCPSRERAGWLCDSFFTARTAYDLCGETRIEKNFLENFLLPRRFANLPEGMLPMCYPADHPSGRFIPNWALWFVVELEEYLQRSGDKELVSAFEAKVLKLFDYFEGFRNSDGLLEKLASWVFIEWSKANDFVQDVNYPSNMLYAAAMASAGRMYGRPDLVEEAERIRETIRRQSFDGTFFIDNAMREGNRLVPSKNRTEVCQYFAFYFEVATPPAFPDLWQKLIQDFGPKRKTTRLFSEIHPANAFVGNVLRLELLSRNGLSRQLLDESLAYQLYMAERTGTLWENDTDEASCNHGFASHGGVRLLYRDVLGLQNVDRVNRQVDLRFTELDLDWCEGSVPTPEGPVEVRWIRNDGKLRYRIVHPSGYRVSVENLSGLDLMREP